MQQSISNALDAFDEAAKRSNQVYFAFDLVTNKFLYLNPAFEQLWGKSIDEISAKPISVLDPVHKEDKPHLIKSYNNVINGAKKRNIEFRIYKSDESIRWLLLKPLLIEQVENRRIIVGLVDDITTIKEHTALIERFASKKDSVLEILSHDLAGPLSTIKATSSLLAEEIKTYNNPALEKMVAIISRTGERSINLIREFVKQEFMESANASFATKRVNIVDTIKESMEQYKDSEADIAKTFEFTFSNKEIFMEMDDYKFMQVINNLISNSIKFTPDGGIISVHIADNPENVLITVADNGIGIPQKYHEGLFEKFNKARRPGLKGEPSVGLGMSLIKTIVEWHKGRIWFESKENEGTTFYIELPKGA